MKAVPSTGRRRRIADLAWKAWNVLPRRPSRQAQAAVQSRRMELVASSGLFDRDWYLAHYPDVAAAGIDPLRHFVESGSLEGRSPGPNFDAAWYLERYPDVRAAGLEPLFHYIDTGSAEERQRSAKDAVRLKDDVRLKANERLRAFLDGLRRMRFETSATPSISVAIVTYNSPELVLGCLSALAEHLHVPSEVIVIDNASGDSTRRLLERIEGARVVFNDDNVHFLRAVNQASKLARGKYILLLNSDAEIADGAVEAAVEAIETSPDTGAVGGRVVLPDGTLQEAGSIVWSDGSCLGYGRGGDPESYEFMFRRDVDFCSGAFLMVRRDVFEALGGLDEAFAPAYYEEVDLCFRIREAGYRILYDPRILVHHFEYGSSEQAARAKRLMQRNKDLFRKKHAKSLARRHPPSPGNVVFARSPGERNRNVLYIDDAVPSFSHGSGTPRTREILHAMVRLGYRIGFVPMRFPPGGWRDVYREIPAEVEVVAGLEAERLEDLMRSEKLEEFMTSRAGLYGKILVSRPHLMRKLVEIRRTREDLFHGVEVIYDAEALFTNRRIAEAELKGRSLNGDVKRNLYLEELSLVRWADKVASVSGQEARQFRESGHPAVEVLGHAVEANPTKQPFELRRDILFVGRLQEDDSPNVDSIVWFAEEVLPIIRERSALAPRLFLIGKCGAPRIAKLAGPRVVALGEVADARRWYDDCKVFVAPTRFAAGIPLKVCDAAAAGIPVVATNLLAGQLEWKAGVELMAADTAEGFADACVRICSDERLWRRIREGALAAVRRDFDPAGFMRSVAAVLSREPEPQRCSIPAADEAGVPFAVRPARA